MNIILNNGTVLEAVQTNGSNRFYQGFNRDTLEFVFKMKDFSIDNLQTIFSIPENTKVIQLQTDEGVYSHFDYVIPVGVNVYSIRVNENEPSAEPIMENRISVFMAQLTYDEKQKSLMQQQIDDLLIAISMLQN